MDNRAPPDYSQSDHLSAAHYTAQQEVPPNSYSTSATPTSDFSGGYPGSARSGSFPEHLQARRYHHTSSNHSGSSGGMAQPQNPSIAASSPTYPHGGQYSPYPPHQDMQHGYAQHAGGAMYSQPRPDWAGYGGPHHGMPTYQTTGVSTPTSAAPVGVRGPAQVYSFVPIPGAQQHKRPRRRYEEIERMYKCGWNGCEKAYGTLNHLNAHVTMQSHGQKRTPEEFKEIRKEWKQRKKEEETQRKQEEERSRSSVPQNGGGPPGGSADNDPTQQSANYQAGRSQVQLPPIGGGIGYQPTAPGQYQPGSSSVQQLQDYGGHASAPTVYTGYPASPYNPNPPMYSQPNGNGNGNGNTPVTKYEH